MPGPTRTLTEAKITSTADGAVVATDTGVLVALVVAVGCSVLVAVGGSVAVAVAMRRGVGEEETAVSPTSTIAATVVLVGKRVAVLDAVSVAIAVSTMPVLAAASGSGLFTIRIHQKRHIPRIRATIKLHSQSEGMAVGTICVFLSFTIVGVTYPGWLSRRDATGLRSIGVARREGTGDWAAGWGGGTCARSAGGAWRAGGTGREEGGGDGGSLEGLCSMGVERRDEAGG